MSQCMLTTFDNPYNPLVDFDKWFMWDCDHNYYSCSYLGRVAVTSDDMSEEEENAAIEKAIDKIIDCDFRHVYKKVKSEDKNVVSQQISVKQKENQAIPA